ncbi:MAG TPA: GntR family transcriptional regulator [Terriglobales bacterium]|nr:GntR family transcriptional regulator [Terriglobales bacterium]
METDDLAGREQPAYRKIETILSDSIFAGRLAPGTVLLEGHLAAIFGSSRTPVKQALDQLQDKGLVSRFDGRGYVVGDGQANLRRVSLTPDLLGLDGDRAELAKVWGWQRIYNGIERELVFRSALGRFRLNELELARYHDVGRTVAHDVLVQAQSIGLVAKDERSRWYIVPLDEKRICDLYDLRELLEPAALVSALQHIAPETLQAMQQRLTAAAKAYPEISAAEMDSLERDLHVSCVEFGANPEILEALKRTRCLLITAKHMLGDQVSYPKDEPFMAEHLAVLDAMQRNDAAQVTEQMRIHLRIARAKVLDRVALFRTIFTGPDLPYIG